MSNISVGKAIGSGFELIRTRPLAVVIWGLIQVGISVAAFAVLAPFLGNIYGEAIRSAASGVAAPPDFSQNMSGMMAMQGISYALNGVQLVVNAMISCAVFRAVLHPGQSRFAYLRLGMRELMVLALLFGLGMVLGVGMLVVLIPVGIIIGILAAFHSWVAMIALLPILFIAATVALMVVGLRFSLAVPMIVDDGKFHLFESWTLTRGKLGSLFLIALALLGIGLLAELIIGGVFAGAGAAVLGVAAGGFDHLKEFFQQPAGTIFAKLSPMLVIMAVLMVPVTGCFTAIFAAPWARAYRDLVPAPIGDTFA